MHEYHDQFAVFPAPAIAGGDGKPLLSWRVALLPYLGEQALYKEFKLDEPWDSAHNTKLIERMPRVYTRAYGPPPDGTTCLQLVVGEGAMYAGAKAPRVGDAADGTSTTVLIAEASEPVPWTKPADLAYDPAGPLPKLGNPGGEYFFVCLADASVRSARKDLDEKRIRAAITRAGREPMALP